MTTPDLVATLAPIIERVNTRFCWVKRADGPRHLNEPLTPARLAKHLNGGPAYGASAIPPGSTATMLAVLDLDSHKGETPWLEMQALTLKLIDALARAGLRAVPFRSSGGAGVHLYLLWQAAQDAYSVREAVRTVLSTLGLVPGTKGVKNGQVEVFPKQDMVPADGYGSMFVLPLAGASVPLDYLELDPQPREYMLGFAWPMSDPVPVLERPLREASAPTEAPELAVLRAALAAIPNEGAAELDYDAWRNVIFGVHHATDGSDEGLALAHEFSARSAKYDPDFLNNRVWPHVRSDRPQAITARTIVAKAREHGWTDPTIADDFEVVTDDVPAESQRFQVFSEDELISRAAVSWLVKDVIPEGAMLGVIYGASGTAKSFLAIDMCAAIANGIPWRGRKTQQRRVVYVAAEGQGGFGKRLKAYQQHYGRKTGLRIIVDAPNLLQSDAPPLIEQIKLAGGADIVVIDTLAQVSPGADENSAQDMGKVLGRCRLVHKQTGALVVLIHHAGKDLTKGARGWSGLKAAADFEIEVSQLFTARWAKVTKLKDGEAGAEFPFKLAPIAVGIDDDGDEVTSCVIEHIETSGYSGAARQPTGQWNKRVYAVALELISVGDNSVTVEALIADAVKRTPVDLSKPDRRRDMARRAISDLAMQGFLVVFDNIVRIPGHDNT